MAKIKIEKMVEAEEGDLGQGNLQHLELLTHSALLKNFYEKYPGYAWKSRLHRRSK